MRYVVRFQAKAEDDLNEIYDHFIKQGVSRRTARRFVSDLKAECRKLRDWPEQGTRREELGPGLRTFGVRRRTTVVFRVAARDVEILRILYGGRDLSRAVRGLT